MKGSEPDESEQGRLVAVLQEAVADLSQADDDVDGYLHLEETFVRYLKARDWKLKEAERMLRESVAWRATYASCPWDEHERERERGGGMEERGEGKKRRQWREKRREEEKR
jgi:hypothetical protein